MMHRMSARTVKCINGIRTHILVCVVDNTAVKSDSHVDDREEDDSHFINGTDLALSVQIIYVLHDSNISVYY